MKATEETLVENPALEKLAELGWQVKRGGELSSAERADLNTHILRASLERALTRLNPNLCASAIENLVNTLSHFANDLLIKRNQKFYQYLKEGIDVENQGEEGELKKERAILIDFNNKENNDFLAVNQFEVNGSKGERRFDLVLFINGLPLLVAEFKNPLKNNPDLEADLQDAFNQLHTYKKEVEDIFIYNQILLISNGVFARIGSLSADFDRFMRWKEVDETQRSKHIKLENELMDIISNLCRKEVLLEYLHDFITFEEDGKQLIKKIAAYHQFYAVRAAVEASVRAFQNDTRKMGIVWHTQGSGKSLSMLFLSAKIARTQALQNPTIVVVTDRNDLDDQLLGTFSKNSAILKTKIDKAESREHLRACLQSLQTGGIIFTTIQKFALRDGETAHPALNLRKNIIVISDEAHRSHNNLDEKIKISADKAERRAGQAKYLREALPNAAFIGFTGTPITEVARDTRKIFGDYISIYDVQDAKEDGVVVPIFYEPRQALIQKSADYSAIMAQAQELIDANGEPNINLKELIYADERRLAIIAKDIVQHFETQEHRGKAMIVLSSREVCVKVYQQMTALRPEWHSADVGEGAIKVVMTGQPSDPEFMQAHIYRKEARKTIEKRFKDPEDSLKIVIVCDMWLTGFDVPCLATMYIDKEMKGHNLAQAIARVNRVFEGKSGGLVVDYRGIADHLKQAQREYSKEGGKGDSFQDIDAAFNKMCAEIEAIRGILQSPVDGVPYPLECALECPTSELLDYLMQAAEHILSLDRIAIQQGMPSRKSTFIQLVNMVLSGYRLCKHEERAQKYGKEVDFYLNVRRLLPKKDSGGEGKNIREELLKLLGGATLPTETISLLDLMDENPPDISLLSEGLLDNLKGSKNKNLWVEAINAYLKKQINEIVGKNLSKKQDFAEKLEKIMEDYHQRGMDAFEVIKLLVEIAENLAKEGKRHLTLDMSEEELRFYDALRSNKSAVELMQDEDLVKIAKEILQELSKHRANVDWNKKNSVHATMRVAVKNILKKYKYPPDNQKETVDLILKQAEQE